MSVAWPESLPQLILEDSYSGVAGDNVLRSEMELGPPKNRLQPTLRGREVSLEVRLTKAEYEQFLEWWEEDLRYGAETIAWRDPARDTAAELRVLAPFNESAEEGYMVIDLEAEILP